MDRDNLFLLCELARSRYCLDLIMSAYKLTRLGLPLANPILSQGRLAIKPAPLRCPFPTPHFPTSQLLLPLHSKVLLPYYFYYSQNVQT